MMAPLASLAGLRSLISNLEARIGHAKKTRKHA
jgi:hypothetical protein